MLKVKVFVCFLALAGLLNPQAIGSEHRFTFEYKVKVALPEGDGRLRLWVPLPRESESQKIETEQLPTHLKGTVARDKKYGNRIFYYEAVAGQKQIEANFSYTVKRKTHLGISPSQALQSPFDHPQLHLKEEKQVPFAPVFKKIANDEAGSLKNEKEKIRKLYDYVYRTMKYDKSGTGWGKGDAVWAYGSKRGNCTDFHSLLIGLSRALSMPGRFIIGFSLPTEQTHATVPGYHCWAESYATSAGWIPMDTTEAKKSGKPDEYFGQLPPNRLELSMGRDLILEPPQSGEPLNFFVYPYAELDGKPFEGVEKEFLYHKLPPTLVKTP